MATKSILKDIIITDEEEAHRFIEALEKAEARAKDDGTDTEVPSNVPRREI